MILEKISNDSVTYSQLKENLSVRYHLRMIMTILWSRFVDQVSIHHSFLIGILVGMGIMVAVVFLIGLITGVQPFGIDFNYYNQPTQELVLLPAPTDTEIIDTEIIGDATNGFQFTGRFIANNEAVNEFQCSFDAGEYVGCTQNVKMVDVLPGEHTFEVRSILGNGTVDPTPAVSVWSVE